MSGTPFRTGLQVTALLLVTGTAAGLAQVPDADIELVVLASPCLYLRPAPDTATEPLRCLPTGRRLTVLESRDSWGRVRLPDNQEGWVAMRLLGPVATMEPGTARSSGAHDAAEARRRIAELQEALAVAETKAAAQNESEEQTRRRIAEMEEALATAEAARDEAQKGAAGLDTEIEALRGEAAELRGANQRLEALATQRQQAEEAMRGQVAELQEALAVAETEMKEALAAAEAERIAAFEESAALQSEGERLRNEVEALRSEAEIESEQPMLRAEATAEAQRQIEDLSGRLQAAEMFLAESDRQRREYARQLASLRGEPEAPRESAGAASGDAEKEPRDGQEPRPSGSAEIMAMVNTWAEAWSKQRVEVYLSFYASSFVPPDGQSRDAWEALRRERIRAPGRINVGAALLELRPVAPDRAEVEFIQSYSSDCYSDTVVKTLELVVESGGWKIARESSE